MTGYYEEFARAIGADGFECGSLSLRLSGGEYEGGIVSPRFILTCADGEQKAAVERLSSAIKKAEKFGAADITAPKFTGREGNLWVYSAEMSLTLPVGGGESDTGDTGGGDADDNHGLYGIGRLYFRRNGMTIPLGGGELCLRSYSGGSAKAEVHSDGIFHRSRILPSQIRLKISAFCGSEKLMRLLPVGAEGELLIVDKRELSCPCVISAVKYTAVSALSCEIVFDCLSPYFTAKERCVSLSRLQSLFSLPYHLPVGKFRMSRQKAGAAVIENSGCVPCPVKVKFKAKYAAENPFVANAGTGEKMPLELALLAGDEIIINTARGEKEISLYRGGERTNILDKRAAGFSFFSLKSGENVISFGAKSGEGGLECLLYYEERYLR